MLVFVVFCLSLHEAPAQDDAFSIDAGPNIAVVAGEEISLNATITGGDADKVTCTWTIAEPLPRFKDEDAGRALGEDCAVAIAGDFTAGRIGLWTVEVSATGGDRTAADTVTIRVAPDTMGNLVLGYFVIFAVGAAFIVSLAWRMHRLRQQIAALGASVDDKE